MAKNVMTEDGKIEACCKKCACLVTVLNEHTRCVPCGGAVALLQICERCNTKYWNNYSHDEAACAEALRHQLAEEKAERASEAKRTGQAEQERNELAQQLQALRAQSVETRPLSDGELIALSIFSYSPQLAARGYMAQMMCGVTDDFVSRTEYQQHRDQQRLAGARVVAEFKRRGLL